MSVNAPPESPLASGRNSAAAATTSAAKLKDEIDRLFELQRQALESAVFLGMTAEQAQELDARRKKIVAMVNQLATLKFTTNS